MKAWLSDGPSEESFDSALAAEVRQLVSKPDVRDFLYVECRADENEALCKDMNGELKELNSIVGFSKQVISHDHSLCFSPGIYPEESAARFFWSFSDKLELHEAGVLTSWRAVLVTVLPHVAANAKSNDGVSFQVQCQSISADAELKLLLSDSPPCEDPKSRDTVLLSAILLPVGTHIRRVRVEALKRERWLFVLQKLSIHRVVQVEPKTTTISPVTSAAACDLYISTCRRSSVSVGRDMKLYFSAIMDSLVRVFDSQVNVTGVKITFQFGNFMAESSESVAANAAVRMFLVTDDLASAFLGDKKRCECDGCQEIFRCVDGTSLASKTCLVVMRSSHRAQLQSIKHIFDGIVEDVFFVNDRVIECVPREAYLEGSELDAQSVRLLAEYRRHFKQPVPVAPLASFAVIQNADLIYDLNLTPQRGFFGDVFKCNWRGTPVAVKKIMRVADQHKFVEEAQMMHSIQHPNCVRLYGVCQAPYPALVMEWMGGGDLSQLIAQRSLPQIHRRLSLFRQICAGLNSLHNHSPDPIIHSDLKPENILLNSDKNVAKIADFGLSKPSFAGTLIYLAPEMLLDAVPSHRPTDVYAMGLILWEMLAGKLVWRNPDGSPFLAHQLIAVYNRRERPPLKELPAGIDPAVIALMQDCWAQDPDQRPTAHELWRRMSVLDTNNPEYNKPLIAYQERWLTQQCSFEESLQKAVPPSTFQRLLLEIPRIEAKYREAPVQQVVQSCKLSEVEAKCIIVYTLIWPGDVCPRNQQLYFLFCTAYRDRDDAALERFANFSFHFWNGLDKLPKHALELFRGFDRPLTDISDLYQAGNVVHWHYPVSTTADMAVASMFSGGGTLIRIVNVTNAKSIQTFSLIPTENTFVLLYTSAFDVVVALPSELAKLLGRFGSLPDNVDLVVLRAK
jgi:serine/threonine protein kinase